VTLVALTPDGRDAVVYVAQAASTGPPWLAIVLAGIALLSAVGVAAAPALVERVKQRGAQPPAPATTPAPPPAVEGSVDLVREAIDDLRRERDEAQDEAVRLREELAQERAQSALKDVQIAELRLRNEYLVMRLGRPE
jgi:hypothetical protein